MQFLGPGAVRGPVLKIMFGSSFLQDPAKKALCQQWADELTNNKRTITRAVRGVINRQGVSPQELSSITCPTLILVGAEDVATVPIKSEYLAHHIPHAQMFRIPRAGHTSSVEEPEWVNRALDDFLRQHPAPSSS